MTKQQRSNRRSLSPTTQILTCLKSHPVLNDRVMRMTQGLVFFFPPVFPAAGRIRAHWKSSRSKARIYLMVLRCTYMKDVKKREMKFGH